MTHKGKFRDVFHGVPVGGVTGINGAGKTLVLVESAIADMAAGRPVYSTVPIVSEWGESIPIRSLRQLAELSDATIVLDEVAVMFSAGNSQSLPPEMRLFLQTLRHRKLTVRWSAPSWMRCDNLLRSVTQANANVVPMLRHSDGTPWPAPRVVMIGLMDTSSGVADAVPDRVLRRRVTVPKRMRSWGAYDTYADTPLLGVHLQTGVCVDCGGSRERAKHSKKRHEDMDLPWYDDLPSHRGHVVEFADAE